MIKLKPLYNEIKLIGGRITPEMVLKLYVKVWKKLLFNSPEWGEFLNFKVNFFKDNHLEIPSPTFANYDYFEKIFLKILNELPYNRLIELYTKLLKF